MATTLGNLLTRMSYRVGESSAVDNTNEKARRVSYINEGYRDLLGSTYWWFLQTTGSDATVSGLEIYDLPSDFREIIELRVNGKISVPIPDVEAFDTYNYPPLYYQYRSVTQKHYVFGDSELHLIPIPSSAPSPVSVSGITRSGTTATATTSSAHGYSQGNYVVISGADQSDYNGTFRIRTVPSTTTFTFTVANSPTTPATGTISAIENNIVYRYWKSVSDLSDDSDTIVVPDAYANGLVFYALSAWAQKEGLDGMADDMLDKYAKVSKTMMQEHNRRQFYNKSVLPMMPENIVR